MSWWLRPTTGRTRDKDAILPSFHNLHRPPSQPQPAITPFSGCDRASGVLHEGGDDRHGSVRWKRGRPGPTGKHGRSSVEHVVFRGHKSIDFDSTDGNLLGAGVGPLLSKQAVALIKTSPQPFGRVTHPRKDSYVAYILTPASFTTGARVATQQQTSPVPDRFLHGRRSWSCLKRACIAITPRDGQSRVPHRAFMA